MTAQPTPSSAALDVLRRSQVTESSVALPAGQLDRKVYDEVNKILTRIGGGGKWNRKAGAHLFPKDPRPELAAYTETGKVPVDHNKLMSFFRTPTALAERMADIAGIAHLLEDALVLEPSAGDGAIADVLAKHPVQVVAVEPDSDRATVLADAGHLVRQMTFQQFDEHTPGLQFAAVVMNPPFTEKGDPVAWATHIALAWDHLAPGGVLVAVAPASLERQHRGIDYLRGLVAAHGYVEQLPSGTFKESGTGVNTMLVVLTKGGAL